MRWIGFAAVLAALALAAGARGRLRRQPRRGVARAGRYVPVRAWRGPRDAGAPLDGCGLERLGLARRECHLRPRGGRVRQCDQRLRARDGRRDLPEHAVRGRVERLVVARRLRLVRACGLLAPRLPELLRHRDQRRRQRDLVRIVGAGAWVVGLDDARRQPDVGAGDELPIRRDREHLRPRDRRRGLAALLGRRKWGDWLTLAGGSSRCRPRCRAHRMGSTSTAAASPTRPTSASGARSVDGWLQVDPTPIDSTPVPFSDDPSREALVAKRGDHLLLKSWSAGVGGVRGPTSGRSPSRHRRRCPSSRSTAS